MTYIFEKFYSSKSNGIIWRGFCKTVSSPIPQNLLNIYIDQDYLIYIEGENKILTKIN